MIHHFERLIQGLQKGFDSFRRDVSTISTRFGTQQEDIFREAFREALLIEGVNPESLRHLDGLDKESVVVSTGEITESRYAGSRLSVCLLR